MKRIVSIFVLFALMLVICIGTAGCKGNNGDAQTDSGEYSNAVPGGAADVSADVLEALSNSGEVSIYQIDLNEKTDAFNAKFAEYFNKVYGGTMNYIKINWNGWEDKFIVDFSAGDAPDVLRLGQYLWPKAASRGLVYSQAELAEIGVVGLDHPVITNSLEIAENNYSYKGNVYALDVYSVNPSVMLVNDTLLAKCGVDKTPYQYYVDGQWNWNSFTEVLHQVASIDSDADSMADYSGYDGWDPNFVLDANAGYLIKFDENYKLFANTDSLNVQHGLQMYHDICKNNYKIDRGGFQEGKTATLVETSYNIAKSIYNKGDGLNFDWSVVPYPLGADNVNGEQVGGCDAYSIITSTENPQGALNFIIAMAAYNEEYAEADPETELEYWLDDEGDQMLADLRMMVREKTWKGVADAWDTQWEFWGAVERMSSIQELLTTYKPWIDSQCNIENAYAIQ